MPLASDAGGLITRISEPVSPERISTPVVRVLPVFTGTSVTEPSPTTTPSPRSVWHVTHAARKISWPRLASRGPESAARNLRNVASLTSSAGGREFAGGAASESMTPAAKVSSSVRLAARTGAAALALDTGDDGLNILTSGTGGLMYHGIDDIGRAIGMVANDTSSYYVIGYAPENAEMDGKFRGIEVKSAPGTRDLHIRARKGYAAVNLPPQEFVKR